MSKRSQPVQSKLRLAVGLTILFFGLGAVISWAGFRPTDSTGNKTNQSAAHRPSSGGNSTDSAPKPFNNAALDKTQPAADEPVPGDVPSLFVLGDIMLDRYIRQSIDSHTPDYPFENIKSLLASHDLLIANLEGPITGSAPQPLDPNNTVFTFDPEVIPALDKLGFDAFSLANNHSYDYGSDGFQETKARLTEAGIDTFGDYFNRESLSLVRTVRGMRIGLVGYHGLKSGLENVLSEIDRLRPEVDKLIVFSHWGSEYQTDFNSTQQTAAHSFIDRGADLVLGSHPHVIQPIEVYQDKAVFYSLGNFIFDQTFSEATQRGLALQVELADRETKFVIVPLGLDRLQAIVLDGDERTAVLSELGSQSIASLDLKSAISQGTFGMPNFASTNSSDLET